MKCQSCNEQRNKLHNVESTLIPSMELYLCSDCKKARLEPRWVVVLAGRSFGADVVEPIVTSRRYLGEEIALRELLA